MVKNIINRIFFWKYVTQLQHKAVINQVNQLEKQLGWLSYEIRGLIERNNRLEKKFDIKVGWNINDEISLDDKVSEDGC